MPVELIDMSEVRNPMTQEEGLEWVEALLSGEFAQGHRMLFDNVTAGYCCLGVEKAIHPELCTGRSSAFLSDYGAMKNFDRLPEYIQQELSSLNDKEGWTFDQIARYIKLEIIPGLPDKRVDTPV